MKKGKAITLLSIVCFILALALVLTFVPMQFGITKYKSVSGSIAYDYDLDGGTAYFLEYADTNVESVDDSNVDEVLKTLQSRMDALGYKAYTITATKSADAGVSDYNFRIEAKGDNLNNDITVVTAFGEVEFYGKAGESGTQTQILTDVEIVADCAYLGRQTDTEGNEAYPVALTFTDDAHKQLLDLVGESEDYALTVKLADINLMKDSVITAETLASKTITIPMQSEESALQYALMLKTGGLAYQYDVESQDSASVTPLLGENSVLITNIALGAVVLALIVAFIVLFKGFGVIASLSTLCFMCLQLFMMIAIPGVVVSSAGIIGMLGATIIFADGILIIAKRMREEFATGKTYKASVKLGYKRAFNPIVNSNVICAIVALVLFCFTGGIFRSFAITFGVGVVISFICTILISRMFTELILPLVSKPEKFLNLKRVEG